MSETESKTRSLTEIRAELDAIAPYPRGDVTSVQLGRHLAVSALRKHCREMSMGWDAITPQGIKIMVTEFAAAMALLAVAAQQSPGPELALGIGPWCPERLRDDPASVASLIRDAWEDGEDVGHWLWAMAGDDAPRIQALTDELAAAEKAARAAEAVAS